MASVAIVPAAGRADRFGSAKLLALVNGEPLLNWTLWALLDGGVKHVVVVTAQGADLSSVKLASDPRVKIVVNEDPSRGMFSSIQTGLSAVTGDPILFLPADMPFVSSGTVRDVLDACVRRQRIVVPVFEDKRGHPIAVPGAMRRPILLAPATSTLKDALGSASKLRDELHVGDEGILRDVDTPDDLA